MTESIAIEPDKKNKVELLIERIQAIQKELPSHAKRLAEEEEAFTEAAEEQY